MRIVLFITLLLSSLMTVAAEKATELFTLDHQMSAHCEKKIKENLRFEKGISKIDVSLKENTIKITYNQEKTDTTQIIKGFKKIGFNAFVYHPECKKEDCTSGANKKCEGKHSSCCKSKE